MRPLSNHDESAVVAAALLSMKNEPTDVCKRNAKEVVPPRKKSRSSVKRTPSNTIRRKCMFRMKGTVEFTEDDKVVVTPDVTCSRIVKGKKLSILGNVICNSCGKCFCNPLFTKEIVKKHAIKRNCFEKHRELKGSVCKDAKFTALSQLTQEEYDKISNKKK